jgi:hypothetical protein
VCMPAGLVNSFFFCTFFDLGPLFLLIFVSIIPAYGLNTIHLYFKVNTLSVPVYYSFAFFITSFTNSSYSKNYKKPNNSLWFCLLPNILNI